MFGKIIGALERAEVKSAFAKGKMRCPECGAEPSHLPTRMDELMVCESCGAKTSAAEWVEKEGVVGNREIEKPVDTKIVREQALTGGVVWKIPASGRLGFLMIFGVLWLGFTALMSGLVLINYLNHGEIKWEGGNELPSWILIPFFGIFWSAGLGVLYAGLRQKYMSLELVVGNSDVVLKEMLFGRVKEKALRKEDVQEVAQKFFYQQNDENVYGVEIRGKGGRLRFGSALQNEEQVWLVYDIRRVIKGKEKAGSRSEGGSLLAPIRATKRRDVFSINLPKKSAVSPFGMFLFGGVGLLFVMIGVFLIPGAKIDSDKKDVFDYITLFFDNIFRVIWICITSFFTIIGFGSGLAMQMRGTRELRVEGAPEEIAVREYKKGFVVKERQFVRSEVTDVRAYQSGGVNDRQLKRLELIVGDRAEVVSSWMNAEEAENIKEEMRDAMGIGGR